MAILTAVTAFAVHGIWDFERTQSALIGFGGSLLLILIWSLIRGAATRDAKLNKDLEEWKKKIPARDLCIRVVQELNTLETDQAVRAVRNRVDNPKAIVNRSLWEKPYNDLLQHYTNTRQRLQIISPLAGTTFGNPPSGSSNPDRGDSRQLLDLYERQCALVRQVFDVARAPDQPTQGGAS